MSRLEALRLDSRIRRAAVLLAVSDALATTRRVLAEARDMRRDDMFTGRLP